MRTLHEVAALARRFLQARRRGPLDLREMTRVLADDAVLTIHGDHEQLVIEGARFIAEHIAESWAGQADDASMVVQRLVITDVDCAAGLWRLTTPTATIYGRDSYRVAGGRIVAIDVETYADVNAPTLVSV